MLPFALGLLAGVWSLHQLADLPPHALLIVTLVAGLSGLASLRLRPAAAILLGFSWAGLYASWQEPPAIPGPDGIQTFQATGVVQSLPKTQAKTTRVLFRVTELERDEARFVGSWLLRISWFEAPELAVGQRWRFQLRVRPANSYRNPGSWDYAGWLYREGVRYTGFVKRGDNELLGPELLSMSDCCRLNRFRAWIKSRLDEHLPESPGAQMFLALTLGDRGGMSRDDRQILASTGTSHLFAISGLHIGLAAAAFGGLISLAWRRVPPLCERTPAMIAGAVAGVGLATLYAVLSGFGVPAQRALVMLIAGVWVLLTRQQPNSSNLFAIALVAVLLWDPFAPLQAGFWLSFVAVAAILSLLGQVKGRHWIAQAVVLQIGIALALYPVLAHFDMPSSLLGPVINLFLVPVFGLLIVPLSLLAVVLTLLAPGLGFVAAGMAMLLDALREWLGLIAQWQPELIAPAWTSARWGLLVIAVILLLAPRGMALRIGGLVLLVGAHLPARPSIPEGAFHATLLDVGQGLSMVVRTHSHVLVYDTGARFRSGFNLADAVVIPFLRSQGTMQIDTLVLSHGDNDHSGAAEVLAQSIPVGRIFEGEPWRNPLPGRLCRPGQHWTWDGVEFTFIQPLARRGGKANNASCVLLVAGEGGRLLIPGDIEAGVEQQLVSELARLAPIDVVVAPHHGSLSSSSEPFVKASGASHVLYPVGHLNRYGFPKAKVDQRWLASGAKTWRSDMHGALRIRFPAQGKPEGPMSYRQSHRRYWHLAAPKEVGQ